MVQLKLGIDLSFARKRWPLPGQWAEIVQNQLGLKYIEFCSDLLDPIFISEPTRSRLAQEVKDEIEKRGLVVHNFYTGLIPHCLNLLSHPDMGARRDGLRWCEEAAYLAARIGATGLGGHFDHMAYADWTDNHHYQFMVENLIQSMQHLSRISRVQGLKFLLWEQMYTPNEIPYTLDQTQEIYERVNKMASVPVYITVDVGHACCQRYAHRKEDRDPYFWLKKFAPISPVIHIQQTDDQASHHWPFTPEYNSRGTIKAEKVLEAIEASGSRENYLMLEIFHPLAVNEQKLIDDLKISVEYWRKYVTK